LDAQTLAAWTDGALTSPERAAVEARAADCAQCRALVAAMVRSEPSARELHGARRKSVIAWLVPALAAAAAFVIWIALPAERQRSATTSPVARPQPSRSEAPPAGSIAPPAEPKRAARPQSQSSTVDARANTATPRGRMPAAPEPGSNVGRGLDALQAQPPPSALGAQIQEQSAKPQAQQPAVSPRTLADSAAATEEARAPGSAPEPMAKMLGARRQAPIVEIVSSNPGSRWRILGNTLVQRSMDGGSTWQTQQTGVGPLTAGASPSPSVCWLVGPGGVVILSTDGRSWRRVAFPEAVDLIAISATDDKTATITTADGRTFSTADAGATWGRTGV
jgi:hypothetical protein